MGPASLSPSVLPRQTRAALTLSRGPTGPESTQQTHKQKSPLSAGPSFARTQSAKLSEKHLQISIKRVMPNDCDV